MIGLPLDDVKRVSTKRRAAIAATALLALVLLFGTTLFSNLRILLAPTHTEGVCPLYERRAPALFAHKNATVAKILHSDAFRTASAHKLGGMVQVDTQIFDAPPPVDEEPEYWTKFKAFHSYLNATFPSVYLTMQVSTVNTYGLVYEWKGSDALLKPVMLTGHQDVVPVQKDTIKDWTYAPFLGHYDGTYVYGRGSSDCKNVVLAIMETLELLIGEGFQPQRTILVALGMDEEVLGFHGARAIGEFLEARYGSDSLYAIVDEGFGLARNNGRIVALPGTCEKGYTDIVTQLVTPGGHSSVPPDNTAIGIMGELQTLIERDPFEPVYTLQNPTFQFMQCMARHAGSTMGTKLRKSILRSGFDKVANSHVVQFLAANRMTRYLVQTSQAMDTITGGEKANALPESVRLLTNHRVAIESSTSAVMDRFLKRVLEIAKRHDLGVVAENKTLVEASGNGYFSVYDAGKKLESAPRTPTEGEVWETLVGVTRHVYEELVFPGMAEPVIVAPAIMTGNTDTRHYWRLTDNIFRYTPFLSTNPMADFHIHSVDERMDMDNHLRVITFFYQYLQVVAGEA